MNQPLTINRTLHFSRQNRGRRRLEPGPAPAADPQPAGRVPRVSRLMALAIRFEQQVRTGQLASYAQLAALGQVTRARVSQIMNLLNLATDIQEQILFLPRTERGRDPFILCELQPIASEMDWRKQRAQWRKLYPAGSEV